VSGSAYKIVNNRAYHHGTMLLATELGTLGDVLHVTKARTNSVLWRSIANNARRGQDSMITRGVASVRSPVRNLCWFQPEITHEAFVAAVVRAFREEYGVDEDVRIPGFSV
jgi:lipoate-protein ligase A